MDDCALCTTPSGSWVHQPADTCKGDGPCEHPEEHHDYVPSPEVLAVETLAKVRFIVEQHMTCHTSEATCGCTGFDELRAILDGR